MSARARVTLVPVHKSIISSWGPRGIAKARKDAKQLRLVAGGQMTPDAAAALRALSDAVKKAGADFRVTDCLRSIQVQAWARAKYERWLRDDKPRTKAKGYDRSKHKQHFVSRPGRSFHNSGRSIDVNLDVLKFKDVIASQQLDTLWAIARPLGWRPVIREATEGKSESWHFDFMGPWLPVYERLGYLQAAMGAVMDIGVGRDVYANYGMRFVQAHLQRAGYDVGDIDGLVGRKTKGGLAQAGLTYGTEMYAGVVALESAPALVWAA